MRWLPLAIVLSFSCGAQAAVLHDDTMPADRPPDAWLGRWSDNASCVAIGPNYVMTTRHPSGGIGSTVVFGGVSYQVTATYDHPLGDIRVATISNLDGTPANLTSYAPISSDTSETSASYNHAVFGGYGLGRGATLVNGSGVTYGYSWAGADNTTLRWGANKLEYTSTITTGLMPTDLVGGHFDGVGLGSYVANEGTPAVWDSGGGWFLKSGGQWMLAGLSRGVTSHYAVGHDGDPAYQLWESWFRNRDTGAVDPDAFDTVRVSSYQPFVWQGGSGSWGEAGKWFNGVPDGKSHWAILPAATAATAISIDAPISIGTLSIDSAYAYTLTGSTITMKATPVNGASMRIGGNYSAAPSISNPINLSVPTTIYEATSDPMTLSGPISGGGNLTKSGWGTLVLSGASIYTGGTIVNAGVLHVPGRLVSAITVNSGGTLSGTGTTTGSLALVGGVVRPSPSLGSAAVGKFSAASVSFASNAVLRVNVNSDGGLSAPSGGVDYGQIYVSGNATGASTSTLEVTLPIPSATGGVNFNNTSRQFTVVSAANATSGFGAVNYLTLGSTTANYWSGTQQSGTGGISIGNLQWKALGGDANLDGRATVLDLQALANNWNRPAANWASGDFNLDGTVSTLDLLVLANNWNQSFAGLSIPAGLAAGAGAGFDAGTVPEPATACLVLGGGAMLILRRRRR